ncbi:SulP family inorganic anion transporter [Kitasatospora sp. CM 4170]|uniref:SulP family inorganic anion transporter n=1 Tax=Kitasatospora aburaviensis TaxID=67265 RepID=A0ABW1EXY6_9ACTN|nr:SulP family inorganic anion transporter [Kitasatospora sp. CM 4170]WNM43707.1 SulP family inorganic anion transporter [Kitasatospora sp. CM 4170]
MAADAPGQGWRRVVPTLPGLSRLRHYRRDRLRGDLVAGVTVAAYLVPQVMAYASVAGLPPVAGLWAILPAIVLYALVGSSRLLSVGPESTTALMTATVVAPAAHGDPTRYAELAAALAVVVGLLCVLAWLARLGFVADLLSQPVLIGYLAGVALIMMVDQLSKLTGVDVEGEGFFPQLASFLSKLSEVDLPTLGFSAATLLLLLLVARFAPRLPGPLLAVVLGTAVSAAFSLGEHGLAVIGEIPAGLPRPEAPDLADLRGLALPALGILLVGYTDFILTARAFEPRDSEVTGTEASGTEPSGTGTTASGTAGGGTAGGGTRLDANQELLALGAVNLGAGFFQGFPVSSSASRTALAQSAGGRSQVYGLSAGLVVVAVLLFLGPLLRDTPDAVLGALVVYAAIRMIDVAGFRRLAHFRRRELLLAVGCLAGVLALDILYGVLVAVGLSVAELLSRVARPHDAVLGLVPGVAGMHDVDDYPRARTVPGLVVYRYDSPLFFANADDFRRRALAAVTEQPAPVRWFVLNTEANVEVDITALDSVDALRRELTDRGIVFALARVKQDLMDDLEAYGLTESVGRDRIFPTLPTAVEAYRSWEREGGPGPASGPGSGPGGDG